MCLCVRAFLQNALTCDSVRVYVHSRKCARVRAFVRVCACVRVAVCLSVCLYVLSREAGERCFLQPAITVVSGLWLGLRFGDPRLLTTHKGASALLSCFRCVASNRCLIVIQHAYTHVSAFAINGVLAGRQNRAILIPKWNGISSR